MFRDRTFPWPRFFWLLSSVTGFRPKCVERGRPLENQGVARVSSSLRLGDYRSTCSSHATNIKGAAAVAAVSGRCLGVRGGANRPLHASVPTAETPTSDTAAEVRATPTLYRTPYAVRSASCRLLYTCKQYAQGRLYASLPTSRTLKCPLVTPVVQEQRGVS